MANREASADDNFVVIAMTVIIALLYFVGMSF